METNYELETTDFINDIIRQNINNAPYESDNEEEFEFFNFAEFEGLVNGEWDTIPNEFHSVKEAILHCKQYEAIRLEESRRNQIGENKTMKTFTVTTFGIFELTENGSILIRKKVKNSNYESIKWIIKNFGNCYII